MSKRARVGADGKTLYDEKGRFAGSVATPKQPKPAPKTIPVNVQRKGHTLTGGKTGIGNAHAAMWETFVKS